MPHHRYGLYLYCKTKFTRSKRLSPPKTGANQDRDWMKEPFALNDFRALLRGLVASSARSPHLFTNQRHKRRVCTIENGCFSFHEFASSECHLRVHSGVLQTCWATFENVHRTPLQTNGSPVNRSAMRPLTLRSLQNSAKVAAHRAPCGDFEWLTDYFKSIARVPAFGSMHCVRRAQSTHPGHVQAARGLDFDADGS